MMFVEWWSTWLILVISPALAAASIEASPVAIQPRIEPAVALPTLVLLTAPSPATANGPLTSIQRPPLTGAAAEAQPLATKLTTRRIPANTENSLFTRPPWGCEPSETANDLRNPTAARHPYLVLNLSGSAAASLPSG